MTVTIQREVKGIRFAETRYEDSLQSIALRELGDAARWPELVSLNELVPPFIVKSSADLETGLLLAGQLIKVPSASQETTATDPDLVFEIDVQLSDGDIQASGGDFLTVSGRVNLRQAMRNVLITDRGELMFHPTYGSLLRRIIGAANGPTAALLAASYAKAAIASDTRIRRVTSASAEVSGDTATVSVTAEPIVGKSVDASEAI